MPATMNAPHARHHAQRTRFEVNTPPGPLADRHAQPDERTYALFNHLVGLASLVSAGIPFLSVIAVLIMWLIRRKDTPFLDDHGKEAVNFQLSIIAWYAIAIAAAILFTIITLGIGSVIFVLTPVFMVVVAIINIIGCVRGAIFAHKGLYFRYPLTFRFVQ